MFRQDFLSIPSLLPLKYLLISSAPLSQYIEYNDTRFKNKSHGQKSKDLMSEFENNRFPFKKG